MLSRQEMEELVRRDYVSMRGRIIEAYALYGWVGSKPVALLLEQPVRVRVADTDETDLFRWDGCYCDPLWNVEVLQPCPPEVLQLSRPHVEGRVFTAEGERMDGLEDWRIVEDAPPAPPDGRAPGEAGCARARSGAAE